MNHDVEIIKHGEDYHVVFNTTHPPIDITPWDLKSYIEIRNGRGDKKEDTFMRFAAACELIYQRGKHEI